jgi:hypothetical protein
MSAIARVRACGANHILPELLALRLSPSIVPLKYRDYKLIILVKRRSMAFIFKDLADVDGSL